MSKPTHVYITACLLACLAPTQAGDTVHILHVIAPARRLVVTPDMGLEGVIEDDEETRRRVVRQLQHQQQGSSPASSSQWLANVQQQQQQRCEISLQGH